MVWIKELPSKADNLETTRFNDWIIIQHKVNIFNRNGELKVELDNWKIKTDTVWLTKKNIDFKPYLDSKIVKVDHDMYSRLNSWINDFTWEVSKKTYKVLEWLYYWNKKSA